MFSHIGICFIDRSKGWDTQTDLSEGKKVLAALKVWALTSPQNLVEMKILRPPWIRNSGGRAQQCSSEKPQWFWRPLKSENPGMREARPHGLKGFTYRLMGRGWMEGPLYWREDGSLAERRPTDLPRLVQKAEMTTVEAGGSGWAHKAETLFCRSPRATKKRDVVALSHSKSQLTSPSQRTFSHRRVQNSFHQPNYSPPSSFGFLCGIFHS